MPIDERALNRLADVLRSFLRSGDTMHVRRRVAKRAGLEIDAPGQMLLHQIAMLDAPRLSDLATRSCLDLSVVSRQVRLLEQARLVVRSPDPDDARASRVALTDEGRDALKRFATARLEMLRALFIDWNEADITTFTELLERHASDFARMAKTL